MKQQTAVEWLIGFIQPSMTDEQQHFFSLVIERAKKMEKEQHGSTWDAAIKAHDDRGHVHARSIPDFDEYYSETYNTEQK